MGAVEPETEPNPRLSTPRVIFVIGFIIFILGFGPMLSSPGISTVALPPPDVVTPAVFVVIGVAIMVVGVALGRRAKNR